MLSDRLQKRKAFILSGLAIMMFATMAFSAVNQFHELVLVRLVQGIGVALMVPAALAVISGSSQQQSRGGSMGFYSTLRMIGFSIGPLLGGYLHVHYGFNVVFFVSGAILLTSLIMALIFVREPPRSEASAARPREKMLDLDLIKDGTAFLGMATFFMSICFSLMSALENEFNARLDQTALGFGIAFSALTMTRLFFQFPLGRLSDRIGRRPVIVAGLIFMAPVTVLLGFAGSTLQLSGARALQGIASAAIAAPALALAADLSHQGAEAKNMSIIAMGFGLGTTVGPMLAGVLAVEWFQLPFIVGGALSLIGAWLVHARVPEDSPAIQPAGQ
jgi:MFS family permease